MATMTAAMTKTTRATQYPRPAITPRWHARPRQTARLLLRLSAKSRRSTYLPSQRPQHLSHTLGLNAQPLPLPLQRLQRAMSVNPHARPALIRDDDPWSSVSAYKPKTFPGGLGAKTKRAVETPEVQKRARSKEEQSERGGKNAHQVGAVERDKARAGATGHSVDDEPRRINVRCGSTEISDNGRTYPVCQGHTQRRVRPSTHRNRAQFRGSHTAQTAYSKQPEFSNLHRRTQETLRHRHLPFNLCKSQHLLKTLGRAQHKQHEGFN
ncbi:uncharacterized protein LAESUDRAFT_412182 [Laetiporus sulphureus 93-53]|uniref:Uncharacterized protein n=1 Tax=Laetiporus sulphureus 93-53 TaxID=1314785 RepID=A0A165C6P6_9APHY|nr:uncharacterized protein LAESUDRAFT_412182 [Laetiporus sulphureus 93-53]KZT02295.1 hypothetical protein LAESUDRAFT_412182 [Laetiporus sulphureus 93-53]